MTYNADEKNNNKFSEDRGNMEIVPSSSKMPASVDNDGLDIDVGHGGKIMIGRLNVFTEPFKKRHERHYKESRFHLWADIVLVSIVVILIGMLIYIKFWQPAKNIFIESSLNNEKVVSGKITSFKVIFGNKNGKEIEDSSLAVTFPKNFILTSVEPSNLFDATTNTFKIGNLASGANGEIRINGIPLGATANRESILFVFNFKKEAENLSVLNSLNYSIESSALEARITIPEKVIKGMGFNGKINIKNSGDIDLDKVALNIGGNNWEIGQNDAILEKNIFIVGKLKKGESRDMNFTANPRGAFGATDFSLVSSLFVGEDKLRQQEISKEIVVDTPKFNMAITSEKKSMQAEDEALFHLTYENKEKSAAKNIKLSLESSSENFSLEEASFLGNDFVKKDNNIFLMPDVVSGGRGAADLKIKYHRKKINTNEEVGLNVGVTYETGEDKIVYSIISEKIKILSNLNIQSAGFYYGPQGDQLGVGPLPPVIDIPTRYWIFWEADNIGNNLKNFNITAELPKNVVLTGNKSLLAGNLQYSQNSKKLIWAVDAISEAGGSYKAGFEIEITPKKTDVGKILTLLTDTRYDVFDIFCNQEMGGNLKDISTNLQADRLAAGKGHVTE